MPAQQMNDHDLLVRLDTKLDALTGTIGEMKTALPLKADAGRVDKLEARVERSDRKLYTIAGGLAAAELFLRLFFQR